MDKKTTLVTAAMTDKNSVGLSRSVCRKDADLPSETTMAFLRQFARAYRFEASLGVVLGGMIAN